MLNKNDLDPILKQKRIAWNDLDPILKQKRIAWSVATSTALETREDAVLIYERIMRDWESKNKSNETQISGKS